MGQITKVKTADYDEWKALRGKYIGGSDAAAVVGLNPYRSQFALWAEKTGKVPGFEGNLATEVGTYLEEFVAQIFARETGKKVRRANQSFLNSDYPWAIANIDREIVGEDAGLEIKTTSELNLRKFKGGEYPAQYYCQAVHYMAVTGKKRWYLAVLIGNREFKWFVIERDEAEIKALMEAEEMFWEFVQKNIPPMPDGTSSSTATLSSLYPESDDTECSLYGYEDDAVRYLEVCQTIKNLETQRDELGNRIKSHMGTSSLATGSQHKVTWKQQSRTTLDQKKLVKDHPEIDLGAYQKVSSYRVFKVAELKGA